MKSIEMTEAVEEINFTGSSGTPHKHDLAEGRFGL
jgi:hypothetical protein